VLAIGLADENKGEDEESLFVKNDQEEEEAGEEYILSELSQRVAEYTVLVQERMVKVKGAMCLEYTP